MYEITTLDEFNNILINNSNVVVDFYADWCEPCKQISPYFEELSSQYPQVFFCKVNIVDNDDITSMCDITSLPTFLFYKNKENVDELIGINKNELLHKIQLL